MLLPVALSLMTSVYRKQQAIGNEPASLRSPDLLFVLILSAAELSKTCFQCSWKNRASKTSKADAGKEKTGCMRSIAHKLHGHVQVFQLPKALAYPLFYKLVAPNSSSVTRDAILSWFEEKNVVQVCSFVSLHCGLAVASHAV